MERRIFLSLASPPSVVRALTVVILGFVASSVLPATAQPAFVEGKASASIQSAVDAALGDNSLSGSHWGITVAEANSGSVLFSRNGATNATPASNMKLFTAATALDRLGPDFRYTTTVYRGGPVEDGVLHGPLIVRGSGDPSIGDANPDPTHVFRAWADSLRAAGIQRINGDIVGDDDVFDDESLGKGWSWDDTPFYYAAQISGLSYHRNVIDLSVRGQRKNMPATLEWAPMNTNYVTIVNQTVTTEPGSEKDENYRRLHGTNTIHVGTTVPAGRLEREELTVDNPTLYFAHVLREVLIDEGIAVSGSPVDVDDMPLPPDYTSSSVVSVASHASPPMSELVAVINEDSDNLYAEHVLRTLAVHAAPDTNGLEPGSAEKGAFVIKSVAAEAGVDTSRIAVADGSGLSRHNLVSPEATITMLHYMWNHPDRARRRAFVESLPLGGRDGTLEYRFRGNASAGRNVRAKTGTLSNVSALSGYVSSSDGTPLVFSIYCMNHTTKGYRIRRAQDRIVNALARL
ncbi:D-alanyl-D-alanine carboxypeptidase/D-alanyl-D-alanine endopeptidase [Longibacter salinarum]|uniref:D-alanyl-D-alanine carboxypeptidase/D-alanyl-D-alanine endopeptidase n=1 Tax=Longibacter salinarum TaxID=1850348 RepID=UPI0015CF0FFB|nr:D-alanyl-D-alanine carboxypeptidase/D-alanyl-D-alanine-endopeptidase [Longibacter salinarum]